MKKQLTQAAEAAAAIRTELKTVFPGIKFRVTSSNYAGGNSVDIVWNDGPTCSEVEAITGKYQYGEFDGMTDCYNNTNSRADIPQAKYVMESRVQSDAYRAVALPAFEFFCSQNNFPENPGVYSHRLFYKTSFPAGAEITECVMKENHEGGFIEDLFEIKYILPNAKPAAPALQVVPAGIELIDYSEKAVVLIGEGTKAIKDQLGKDGLGGRFNRFLTCGAGWVFSKKRLPEIKALLKIA